MRKILNFLLGYVLVEVRGSYPERFFNLCARHGIEFWGMENRELGVFRIKMRARSFFLVPPVARKSMCRVHIVSKVGLPFMYKKIQKRRALLFGCAAFCAAAWVFCGFVWTIEIDGFPELSEEKLLASLYEEGVRPGVWSRSLELSEIKNNVLIKMPELSYVSINFSGARAYITARKRTEPPEILPENEPCDIVAKKDGVIYKITVKTGTGEVSPGDTVTEGQLLASGYITGRAGTTILTHADAEIFARTWTRKSAMMQKKYDKKRYTGREKKCYSIILAKNRIKLYQNSRISYTKCDKIIKTNELTLFGDIRLPLALEEAVYREYETEKVTLRDEEAFERLGKSLNDGLEFAEDVEVCDITLRTDSDESVAYASISAECIEKIGVERKVLREE